MNKSYLRSGLNIVKTILKVAFILMILGIAITTYAASQADLAGNYYEISANQSQDRYLGYFELGEDVQIGIGASFLEAREEYDNRFTDNLMNVVLLHSESRDFSVINTIYSVETSELYRDFSADQGYYKLVVTNLTDEKISYVVIEAHSSTSMLAILVFGLVLIGIGFAIVGATIGLVFQVLMILAIIFIVRSVMENEQRKRKSPIVKNADNTTQYAGYMPSSP
ncbi:MAG: hypothetical protein HeimC2_36270 [Candidatus Heimdallarchaeota archaeon LC_2]|nr:MAG: hypothetical protein HeimC2_36270 [Candidatus Heimdallarchaeota archaeon LC_2]